MKLFSAVRACELPVQSMLSNRIQPNDFVDCYRVKASIAPRPAAQIIANFPGWADFLLKIRRWVTSPFGLSQDGPDAANKIGVFSDVGSPSQYWWSSVFALYCAFSYSFSS